MGVSHHIWTEEEDDFLFLCLGQGITSPSEICHKMKREASFSRNVWAIRDRIAVLQSFKQEIPMFLMPTSEIPDVFGFKIHQMKYYTQNKQIPSHLIDGHRYYDITMLDILAESRLKKGIDWDYFQQECSLIGIDTQVS